MIRGDVVLKSQGLTAKGVRLLKLTGHSGTHRGDRAMDGDSRFLVVKIWPLIFCASRVSLL